MKKLHYALIAMLLAAPVAMARQLTPEEALQAAKLSQSASAMMKSPGAMKLAYTAAVDGFKGCYVFARGENSGYVVLAADDAVAPVLGYADQGKFDANNIPESMSWLLEMYAEQIKYASENSEAAAMGLAYKAPESMTPVTPICTTLWDQGSPYNNDCPTINGKLTVTGCVATAMAQVIKAHNWPVKGTGSKTYTFTREGVTKTVTANFGQHTYDWTNMLDSYTGDNYTQAQADAVAQLMFDCGVATEMSYGVSSSGAVTPRGAMGMIDYLGYDKGMRWIYRNSQYLPQWNQMVYNEVKAGRPVLLSGHNPEGGHAFVCDGYSNDYYFHINWGWGGMSNGYFKLTLLDPYDQGYGGTSGGYTTGLAGLFGCKPAVSGSKIIPSVFCQGGLRMTRSTVMRTSNVAIGDNSLGTVFTTTTLANLSATLGVKLENVDNGEVSYIMSSTKYNSTSPGTGFYSYSLSGQKFPSSGTYTMTCVFQTTDGTYYPVSMDIGGPQAQMVKCSPDRMLFTPVYAAGDTKITEFNDYGGIALGQPAVFTTVITTTSEEFLGNVTPQLLNVSGSVIASGSAESIDVTSEEPLSYAWYVNFPQSSLAVGEYTVRFYSTERNLVLGSFPVTVLPNPGTLSYSPATVSCEIQQGRWSQASPAVIDRNADVTVKIPVTSGQFSRPVRLAWGANTAKIAGQTDPVIIVARSGDTGTYTFKAPFANVESPSKYYGLMVMSVDDNNKPVCINDFGVSKRVWFTLTGEAGGVEDVIADGAAAVTLYPNPVVDTFTLEGNGIDDVNVYSLTGTLVLKANGNGDNSISLNASTLASGHYIVTVATADGTVAKRMIKQ